MIKIKVNGDYLDVKEGSTVKDILKNMKLNPGSVALEINSNVVDPLKYGEIMIKNGDTVEILHFVGGG